MLCIVQAQLFLLDIILHSIYGFVKFYLIFFVLAFYISYKVCAICEALHRFSKPEIKYLLHYCFSETWLANSESKSIMNINTAILYNFQIIQKIQL